jgi:hypothetical protein
MSDPFFLNRIPGGEIDPQFDRHIRKKDNTSDFSHEKYDPKACIAVP